MDSDKKKVSPRTSAEARSAALQSVRDGKSTADVAASLNVSKRTVATWIREETEREVIAKVESTRRAQYVPVKKPESDLTYGVNYSAPYRPVTPDVRPEKNGKDPSSVIRQSGNDFRQLSGAQGKVGKGTWRPTVARWKVLLGGGTVMVLSFVLVWLSGSAPPPPNTGKSISQETGPLTTVKQPASPRTTPNEVVTSAVGNSIASPHPEKHADFNEFIAAAASGDLAILEGYIAAGLDVNRATGKASEYRPKTGYTALSHAANAGQADALEVLLKAGARVDGDTLSSAASSPNPEIIRMLLREKIKYSVGDLTAAAANAAGEGRTVNLVLFLDAGANPNPSPKLNDGLTPLMLAAMSGQPACVDILLRRGANPNIRTAFGDTPLIRAAYAGNLGIVKLLVNAGASLTAKNGDGDTPYRAAKVMLQDQTVAKYLKGRESVQLDRESGPATGSDRLAYEESDKISIAEGTVTCSVQIRSGLVDKVIVFAVGSQIYAINGKARSRTTENQWIDGAEVFSAKKMQVLMKKGLEQCP
jgi:hypothetical protein